MKNVIRGESKRHWGGGGGGGRAEEGKGRGRGTGRGRGIVAKASEG